MAAHHHSEIHSQDEKGLVGSAEQRARDPGEPQAEERVARRLGGHEVPPAPLLDINVIHQEQTDNAGNDGHALPSREQTAAKRQKGRLYQRMMTGFWWNRRRRIRFLTVTSAPGSPPSIQPSWHELVRRIRKTHGPFEYFAVQTDEGHGVIHSVYVGPYIPFDWLQEQWKAIHGAVFVNIKDTATYDQEKRRRAGKKGIYHDHDARCTIYHPRGLVLYFLGQYLHGQQGIVTISQSHNWVYPGVVGDWNQFRKRYPYMTQEQRAACIEAWHLYLDEKQWPQQELSDHGQGIPA